MDPQEDSLFDSDLKTKSRNELDGLLLEARREMSECTLASSWAFTIPAVLVSIPLGVRYKTYAPLVMAAVTASGFDYYRGLCLCDDFNNNIKKIKYAIAMQEHGGKPPFPPRPA